MSRLSVQFVPRQFAVIGFLCVLTLGLGSTPVHARAARLDLGKIDARLRKAKIRAASYGLVVRERGPRGRTVITRGADRRLVPASVVKVLTGAAALDVFGPGHEFRTRLTMRGALTGDTLDGDLVLHGSGDPTLGEGTSSAKINEMPNRFAQAVAARGIRRVTGALVLDDAVFDRVTFHPKWPADDIVQRYGAGVSGLTFHHGCIRLHVQAGKADGSKARVSAPTTTAGMPIRSKVTTTTKGKTKLGAYIRDGTVHVRGTVKAGVRGVVQVPVPSPTRLAGAAFLAALRRADIQCTGDMRLVRSQADRQSGELLVEASTPLRGIIRTMNLLSQNQYASHLFKAVGAQLYGRGTWASGSRAISEVMQRRGVESSERNEPALGILDGSGLSIHNRMTTGALVQVLASIDSDALRGPWLFGSLPTSGVDGTLRKRLGGRKLKSRIHAKTGTLGDVRVRSLAGFVDGKDEHPGYVFAIVLNKGVATHGVVDDLVRALFR